MANNYTTILSDKNYKPDWSVNDESNPAFIKNKPLSAAKIQTGSYTGTGKSGSSNQNSLTFNFTPKIVIIMGTGGQYPASYGAYGLFMHQHPTYRGHRGSGTPFYGLVTWSGNTMSWYCDYDGSGNSDKIAGQLNTTGYTYEWVAIG